MSFQKTTRVASTVAACTATSKLRSVVSIPNRALPMARWPLLLTGRYSVRP